MHLSTIALKEPDNFAIFPGSFLPFHKGHNYVYQQAKKQFQNVIIVKARNPMKKSFWHLKSKIPYSYLEWNEFIPTLCERLNIFNIVRGYRNIHDYLFEKQLCLTYRILNFKINFHLIFSDSHNIHYQSKYIRR